MAVGAVADIAVHLAHGGFDALLGLGQVGAHASEDLAGRAVGLAQNAEEEVFYTYSAVFEADSLVAAVGNSLFGVVC